MSCTPVLLGVPQVMGEIEAKSELVREQDREYSRVQAAHEQMAASLALATSEGRMHAARVAQLEAEMRRDESTRRRGTFLPSGNSVWCTDDYSGVLCMEHREGSRGLE
jgi:hypothetical protein